MPSSNKLRGLLKRQPVVPSKMNPVEEGNNQFAELFKAMPAGRIGKLEDIVGAVIYLSSQAGVSMTEIWG